jgi:hypothetical protein
MYTPAQSHTYTHLFWPRALGSDYELLSRKVVDLIIFALVPQVAMKSLNKVNCSFFGRRMLEPVGLLRWGNKGPEQQ